MGNAVFEMNEQAVNDIYLRLIATGIDTFSTSDSATLYSIAAQCPKAGGQAVYFARSIYGLIADVIWEDDDRCFISSDRMMRADTDTAVSYTDSAMLIKLYPNPARNLVNILFIRVPDNSLTLDILDILGGKVQCQKVSTTSIATIEIKNLADGLYVFRLSEGLKIVKQQKISIIH